MLPKIDDATFLVVYPNREFSLSLPVYCSLPVFAYFWEKGTADQGFTPLNEIITSILRTNKSSLLDQQLSDIHSKLVVRIVSGICLRIEIFANVEER